MADPEAAGEEGARRGRKPPRPRGRAARAIGDLFDSPLRGRVNAEKTFLEFPFFELERGSKRPHLKFRDEDTGDEFEVKAIHGQGVATITDRDLLLYIGALMSEKIDRGETPGTEFVFSAHDFFRVANRRNMGKGAYENLENTLERLKGTLIKTNIRVGGERITGWWNWLDSGTAMVRAEPKPGAASDTGRLIAVKVVLNRWLHKAIVANGGLIEMDNAYFDLRPVEKRIYDLARVHVGDGHEPWLVPLTSLRQRVGSAMAPKKFRLYLADLSANGDRLIHYSLRLLAQGGDGGLVPVTSSTPTVGVLVEIRPKQESLMGP